MTGKMITTTHTDMTRVVYDLKLEFFGFENFKKETKKLGEKIWSEIQGINDGIFHSLKRKNYERIFLLMNRHDPSLSSLLSS